MKLMKKMTLKEAQRLERKIYSTGTGIYETRTYRYWEQCWPGLGCVLCRVPIAGLGTTAALESNEYYPLEQEEAD